jgi:small subunit ribosomal protein S7
MRKRKPKVRLIAADPRYGDTMVTQFVNNLMYDGKKSTAFTVFYEALDIIKEKTGENEHQVWKKALQNAMPQVEVRSRRIGGATFQIPTEIRPKRKIAIGMKWLINFARKRSGKGVADKLAAELLAEANRAFAHYKA